ncbi:unnamed protein product [Tenebrio molitor]|nr:unnamed protein product [Tenebrio molitor]
MTTSMRPTSQPTTSAIIQEPPVDPFSVPPPNFGRTWTRGSDSENVSASGNFTIGILDG